MSRRTGRNDPCPCGSGQRFKRCCLGRDVVAPAGIETVAAVETPAKADADAVTLLVETSNGWMRRTVPAASPLRPAPSHGAAAENATHDAATTWGLPDFAYRPKTELCRPGA
ncbi:SEC-C metal-binding domain-containing protein [Conexibacter sp. SYSU D00693]|uniref:SEC-C metal-binding domain-containing protein n=1 Tax=Conexibacter sp. SYSU D00693 TaxID=2812560 RepID=UPI00196B907B